MAQITNFFLGANSGSGFQNLFSEIMDPETAFDIMILKGGPGVGKNTFMREIGRTMEQAGADVEYLWCSGDPDSLDGVVIPAIRCAVCDGTSPHGTAPLYNLMQKSMRLLAKTVVAKFITQTAHLMLQVAVDVLKVRSV